GYAGPVGYAGDTAGYVGPVGYGGGAVGGGGR
ncbi:MAG: hypothetical protein QOG80_2890, partial [Pseudonocardiales bacterium]|nr:hypothetical protein [Pseudonocardiales bacterium]